MKKFLWMLILLLILCLSAGAEAQEITGSCTLTYAAGSWGQGDMRDQSYLTYYNGRYLEVETPADAPCYGVYLCLSGEDVGYCIQTQDAEGNWEISLQDDRGYVNSYLSLPGLQHFRIALSSGEKISIAELHLLGEGEIPGWVQDWKDFEGKADLMVLSAHADDELLFFGGTIPYYAAERGMKVIVCYMTHQTPCRRNELLDGLWHCGIREYPSMGIFPDGKNNSLMDNYSFWGKEKVHAYVTGLFRKYQPEVVVTHDVKGEYGHGAHKTTTDAAKRAVELAADAAYAPELGEAWQVKKLYLHLLKENEVVMDWRQPLPAFQGRTAHQVATEAFAFHKSQRANGLTVQDQGEYANNRFGLYFSTVGPDEERNDFFENIP